MSERRSCPLSLRALALLIGVLTLTAACGWSGWDTKMTTVLPKSDFGRMTHDVFLLIGWWTFWIFVLVEAALLFAVWRFRERPGAPVPRQIHGHTVLEISWTVAFAVILLIIGIPTIRVVFKTQEAPAATALRVDVSARQWWWEFRYPGLRITTANEAHVPVGQAIAFHLNGPDVIHSFWIPQLGGKRDVVPGRINRLVLTPDTPGEYLGQCAEYCGTSHANMRFRVVVHPREEFAKWVAAQQAPAAEPTEPLAQRGREVFAQSACVGCHTIAGVSVGLLGPDLTHFGSRKTFGGGLLPSTPETLVKWIENPGQMKPGVLMPALGLGGEQSRAVAAYLLSLK